MLHSTDVAERNKLEVLCPMHVVSPSIEGVNCICIRTTCFAS